MARWHVFILDKLTIFLKSLTAFLVSLMCRTEFLRHLELHLHRHTPGIEEEGE